MTITIIRLYLSQQQKNIQHNEEIMKYIMQISPAKH